MFHRILCAAFVSFLSASSLSAAIVGQYVRIEAPASSRMSLHEIEIHGDGKNLTLHNEALKFTGHGYKGRDVNFRNEQRRLIDGVVDLKQRGFDCGTVTGLNPWLEIDLGRPQSLDKVALIQSAGLQFDDRGLRLVSILDAGRKVVWTAHFDVRQQPDDQGKAEFTLQTKAGPLVGRTIAVNRSQWVTLGDVLPIVALPMPPDGSQRAARFAERGSPASVERLAREFYARLDSSRPELAEVRTRFERGDYAGALDAYRDHFLGKLQTIAYLHEHPLQHPSFETAGDDLLRGIAPVFSRADAVAMQFTPGTIDWAYVASDDEAEVATARVRTRAGMFQRPLLTAYHATGRAELLAQWSAITDDWGMNILVDLERSRVNLREYFVKEVMQELNHLADELAQTARERPEFAQSLSGATLARLLIPILEEYPPAYWWPCRRATFNHTFNALNAATISARILDDFHAGQRLADENRKHWQRLWTMMVTRDGSMQEIGDEGHLFMQWRTGVAFNQMQKSPPGWFTPDFAAEFATGWKQTTTYPIRHLTPDGRGHRFNDVDLFDLIWELTTRTCTYGGMIPRATIDSSAIMKQPEVASILQSVFGAGRNRAQLSPERQAAYDKVTAYYGKVATPPDQASDWLPYAGLHYLRRSWEPDATFVAMICQPTGHPSTNGSDWNTEYQVRDFGQALFRSKPVVIDRQTQYDAADRQSWWPGSKTVELSVAAEKPIPARWHSSPTFDYAESWFEGTYQKHGVNAKEGALALDEKPIRGARAERRIVFLKPLRLVVATDAVRTPPSKRGRTFEIEQRFGTPEVGDRKSKPTGSVSGDAALVTLTHADAPGATIRRFSSMKLGWNPGKQPAWSEQGGLLTATGGHDLLLTTLVEPHRRTGETIVRSARDLSKEGVTGFTATLNDGSTATWLATLGDTRPLIADGLTLDGEGLFVWKRTSEVTGLALGAKSFRIGGATVDLRSSDFEFTIRDGRLAAMRHMRRPIDPVSFSPAESVFVGNLTVTMSSATPDVEIRYTTDGREPDLTSPLYAGPQTISADTYLRARAFRPGLKSVPFEQNGISGTVVSEARYTRQEPLRPVAVPAVVKPGLKWELVEDNWSALFSHLHLPAVMPALKRGATPQLLDVSMRGGDGPFGVRYTGYVNIPADGVWTFHAPPEYVGASCEPGYDLRLWIDDREWDPGQRYHGRGLWSIALARGPHRFSVTFADARNRDRTVAQSGLWRDYPTPWVVWKGESPQLRVSGAGMARQLIPESWFSK